MIPRRAAALILALASSSGSLALAQSPPADVPAPAPSDEDPALLQAKDLNRQGIAILDTGDVERALELFRSSRTAYPAAKNTANVAICLDRLGRDEAAYGATIVWLPEIAVGHSF